MKRLGLFAVLVLLLAACGGPTPSATPSAAAVASPAASHLPAPEALLAFGSGGAVRVAASCWDTDLADCPWSAGVGLVAKRAAADLRLRIIGATPKHFTVDWRPAASGPSTAPATASGAPASPGTSLAGPGPLAAHLEGEALILDAMPPLPATLRFEASWTSSEGPRQAVFFFRLQPAP